MITTLIDKQDTFEVVRDQLAAILLVESTEQQALATAAGEDPELWRLRVYSERANPWEQYVDDPAPLVNVWFDNSSFEPGASNTTERQKAAGSYNVDCYGYGVAVDDGNGGHDPGDLAAALVVHRAVRLVRNILMAAPYTYLGLRGTVWQRWITSVQMFQPDQGGRNVQQVVASRLSLNVDFSEFAPQVESETLDLLSVEVRRTEDGEIVFEADYDYT